MRRREKWGLRFHTYARRAKFQHYIGCLMIQLFGFFKLLSFVIKDGKTIAGNGVSRQVGVCILLFLFPPDGDSLMLEVLLLFIPVLFAVQDGKIIAGHGDIRQIRVCMLFSQISPYTKCLMVQLLCFFIPVVITVQAGKKVIKISSFLVTDNHIRIRIIIFQFFCNFHCLNIIALFLKI